MSDSLITPDDVVMLKRIAHKHVVFCAHAYISRITWYVMTDSDHETPGTAILDAEHVCIVCHPDNERRLRDMLAVAQEHT